MKITINSEQNGITANPVIVDISEEDALMLRERHGISLLDEVFKSVPKLIRESFKECGVDITI